VFSRRNIFRRDRYTCQYCGEQRALRDLTIDHVVPRSREGRSTWENCVVACVSCNSRKANRLPAEAGMRLNREPRRPSWMASIDISRPERQESWNRFLSRAYWDVELKP
jgi:5-methylcytosine-specific restriction endonuclease McrA